MTGNTASADAACCSSSFACIEFLSLMMGGEDHKDNELSDQE